MKNRYTPQKRTLDDPPTLADAYRKHPEGFRSLAEKAEGKLARKMKEVIEREDGPAPRTPVDTNQRFEPGAVYLIKSQDGHYKIGVSKSPADRLEALQRGSSKTLELVQATPVDEPYQVERELHDLFSDSSMHGEWFDLDRAQILRLRSVLAENEVSQKGGFREVESR